MKLDFLKTLQEVQPCGLRAIIEVLDESYPVMAYSDWKELAVQLIDAGFIKRQGNGQYNVTPAGKEAIAKGKEFLEDALGSDQESDEPEGDHGELKITAADIVKAKQALKHNLTSKPAPQATDSTVEEPKSDADGSLTSDATFTADLAFKERNKGSDVPMKFYAWRTKSDLEKVDTDELLSRHQVLKEHLDEIKSVVNQRVNSTFYPSTQLENRE